MSETRSKDQTEIAFDRLGGGQPVIVVGGATCDRARMHPISEELARDFEVINYDRRGRGESGDTQPYAVGREVEDIAALIDEAGGSASVYGHSSGAALALNAAAAGLPIERLILHDPPYSPEPEGEDERRAYGENLRKLLGEDRRGDAVELFFSTIGMPASMVAGMRSSPFWPALEAIAPTLAYDSEVMGHVSTGSAVPLDLLERVRMPVLVICGGANEQWWRAAASLIADGVAQGRLEILDGAPHVVAPEVVAPVIAAFVRGVPEAA
jgi:pimeloyl-ACP methyl ester carboxylesterase